MQAQPKPQRLRFHTDFSSPHSGEERSGEESERAALHSGAAGLGLEQPGAAAAEGGSRLCVQDEEDEEKHVQNTTATSLRNFQSGRV